MAKAKAKPIIDESDVLAAQEELENGSFDEQPEPDIKPQKGLKNYTSAWPNHRIGNTVQFKSGVYSTAKPAEQKMIESDPNFGRVIFETKTADPFNPKLEPGGPARQSGVV